MKNKTLLLVIISIVAVTMLTNCKETSKKETQAKNETTIKNKMETTVKADWDKFKKESEALIKNAEKEMGELGEKIAKANKGEREILMKNLEKLKQKNKALKEKLSQRSHNFKENLIKFDESADERQKKFEREFTHDTRELKTAIKDFFKNNVD